VIRDALILARTNVLLELRRREVVLGMLQFVVATLVIVHFALGGDRGAGPRAAAGMLWVAIVLTAVLALNRTFAADTEESALDALLLAPVDRAAIWLGKVLAQLAFLTVTEIFAVPLFWIFFLAEGADPDAWPIIAAIALANIGLASVGVVVAALAQATRTREVLLPVLFLPLAIPLVIAAVTATIAAVDGNAGTLRPLGFLALYGTFFAVLAWGVFDHLVAE
jgi:heme exporter protein B